VSLFNMSGGNYVVDGWVDLAGNGAIPQQFACTLKIQGDGTIDSTPAIYGQNIRLSLGGAIYLPYTSQNLQLLCGSDSPAKLTKAHFSFTVVDHLTAPLNLTLN
jgi:hypothetical protein